MMPQYKRYKTFPYPVVDCSGDDRLTVQADANEVDINKIVARAIKGQGIPVFDGQPFYGDVSEFTGLQDMLIKAQAANDLFMAYPADLRERFDNDPVKFVDFLSDPGNQEEAVKLGLAHKRPDVQAESAAPATPQPEQ